MRATPLSLFCLLVFLSPVFTLPGYLNYNDVKGKPYTVSYDKRSLYVNGDRSLFLSGSVHPPRSTVSMWDDILSQAAASGLNMIEVYVFWNFHEPVEGEFNWEDRGDLALFVEKCAQHNLFVNLRIGPYVCAEWEYGGIPTWLGFKEGVEFRTNNPVWTHYMGQWFQTVVDKLIDYFPKSGGPIVLVQVENEYAPGTEQDRDYVAWCGDMANKAVGKAPVPIIMCNGASANNTINTCNGNNCAGFISKNGQSGRILIDQPALWTENEGGFQVWGESPSKVTSYFWGRSISDISFAILQWFARGGSHMNYYMYFGGNNYDWPGSSITNMYASDVNICPDALPHEPKYTHLKKLHNTIAQYSEIIVNDAAQLNHEEHLLWFDPETHTWKSGTKQFAYVYTYKAQSVAFLENDDGVDVMVQYSKKNYTLPMYSTSIVNNAGDVVFGSSTVAPPTTHRVTVPVSTTPFAWKIWTESVEPSQTSQYPSVNADYPLEASSVNKGLTQFLYYQHNISLSQQQSGLTVSSARANSLVVFLNGKKIGEVNDHNHYDGRVTLTTDLTVPAGMHTVTILSESLGFDNGMGARSTRKLKGITGDISIGNSNITGGTWNMRPYLAGEVLKVYTPEGSSKVTWSDDWKAGGPITWYKTTFENPNLSAAEQLLLEPAGLSRGKFYINGHNLGRYWTLLMNDGSGKPTQTLYHISKDFLVSGTNTITLIDILGADDPSLVRLYKRYMADGPPEYMDSVETCPM